MWKPAFSNALDSHVPVDLRRTAPAILERYMGRAGATRFLSYPLSVLPAF